jgi:hypothetical protein
MLGADPGNAILLNGVLRTANREIGVPGAGGPDAKWGDELGCPTRRVCVWEFWPVVPRILSTGRIDYDQPSLSLAAKCEEMQMATSTVTIQSFPRDTNPHA